jgi:hypothetical protein
MPELAMPLTHIQLERIAVLREDEEGLDEAGRLALINEAESSEELQRIVHGFPLSLDHTSYFQAVIRHPKCAKGTAHLVYWGSNPGYLYRELKKRNPFNAEDEERWALLMKIEERVRGDRYTGDPIAFSFAGFINRPFKDEALYNPGILSVPEFMRAEVAGSTIP